MDERAGTIRIEKTDTAQSTRTAVCHRILERRDANAPNIVANGYVIVRGVGPLAHEDIDEVITVGEPLVKCLGNLGNVRVDNFSVARKQVRCRVEVDDAVRSLKPKSPACHGGPK